MAVLTALVVLFSGPVANAQDLNWNTDVGTSGIAGDSTFDPATNAYHLVGAGSGLAGTTDTFHFAYYQVVRGDGEMVVRLASADALAQAALVLRESLDASAPSAAVAVRNGSAQFVRRLAAGNNSVTGGTSAVSLPCWLKIVRSGTAVNVFVSVDGQAWTSLGSDTVPLGNSTVYVGLAVSNGTANAMSTATATFDGVRCSFLPSEGLQMWLKADTGVSVDANGAVSTWMDVSGHGNDAVQGDSTRQPLLASGTCNGLPALHFVNGTYLHLPDHLMDGAGAGELFLMLHSTAPVGAGRGLLRLSDGSGDWVPWGGDGKFYEGFGSSQRYGPFNVAGGLYTPSLYELSSAPGQWAARLNGQVQYITTGNTVAFPTTNLWLGIDSEGTPFEGDIAEALLFSRALTSAERAAVEAYFNTKYQYNPPPAVPTSLTVETFSPTQVLLSWNESSLNVTGYTVERQNADGSWLIVANLAGKASSYVDGGLSSGTAYTYRITARNGQDASPASAIATGSVAAGGNGVETFPLIGLQFWVRADNGVFADGGGAVNLWIDQSGNNKQLLQNNAASKPKWIGNDLNGHPAIRFDGNDDYLDGNLMSPAGQELTLFTVTKGTQYQSLLRFQGAGGDYLVYPWSSSQILINSADGGVYTGIPCGLVPGAWNIGEATIKAGDRMSTYCNSNLVASRAANNAGLPPGASPLTMGRYAGGSEYLQADVAEVLIYTRALNDAERKTVEAYLNAKYAIIAPPDAPLAPNVSAISATQANLLWTAPGNALGYSVERKLGSSGTYGEVAAIAGGEVEAYIDNDLTPGASYVYRIRAENAAGNSAYSDEVSVTLPPSSQASALPTDDLLLWLRPDAGVTQDASHNVTAWSDASGHGNNAFALISNSPRWVASALNGQPAIRFDGTHGFLRLPAGFSDFTQGLSALIVTRPTQVASWQMFFDLGNGAGVDNLYFSRYGTSDNLIYSARPSTQLIAPGALTLNDTQLLEVVHGSSAVTLYKNGNQIAQTSASAMANVERRSNFIGEDNWNEPLFQGDIAEVLLFDHALTEPERQRWEQYLNAKYKYNPAPTAPTQLAATALSGTQAALSWVDTFVNISGYRVERQNADGTWSLVMNLGGSATSCFVNGLTPSSTYIFRVTAYNPTGDSISTQTSLSLPAAGSELPIANLKLWLHADGGIVADANNAVTQWLDGSGHNYHAQQTDPVHSPHLGTDPMSGRPVVRFDGTTSEMALPDFMAGASAGEMFIVHRSAAAPNADNGWHDLGGDSHYDRKYYAGADGRIYDSFGSSARKDTGAPLLPLDQFHLYNVASQAGEWTSRLNGFLHFTTTDNAVAFYTATGASYANPRLGANSYGNAHFKGDVAELLVYDHVLSAPEREAVGRYLLTKYSLATSPAPPTGVVAAAVSATQISLVWSPGSNGNDSTIYTVERRGPDGSWVTVAQLADFASFFDQGLQPGTPYTYRVTARTAAGSSAPSQEYALTTPGAASVAAPSMPLAGMRLWLRADAGLSGDGTSLWLDQSGRGNHARQNVQTQRPALVPGAANGRPVVRFDGTTSEMALPDFMAGASAGEMFIVHRSAAAPNADNGWHDLGGDSHYDRKYYAGADGRIYDSFGSSARKDTGAPLLPLDQFHLYNVASQAGEWTSRLNGFLHFTTTDNAVAFYTATGASYANPRLGANSYGNAHFKGDVAELLVYDHVLSAPEREAVGRYLLTKYSLATSPAPPTGVVAAAVSATQISLVWSPGSNGNDSTIYTVERRGPDGSWVTVAQLADFASFFDQGLQPGTPYTYRVTARTAAGSSAPSQEYALTTPGAASVAAPSMPLAGMRLWLRADAGLSGDGTSLWLDQSGRGNHARQNVQTQRPALVPGAANGRPVVRFDGTTSEMALPDFMAGASAGEMFIVHRSAAAPNADNGWHDLGGDSHYDRKYYAGADGRIYDSFGSSARKDTGAPLLPLDQFHLYNVASQAGEWTSRLNGFLHFTTTDNAVAFYTATGASYANPRLGANSYGNAHFKGDVAELLVYDHVLSAPEREAVGRYLNDRYAMENVPTAPTAPLDSHTPAAFGVSPKQVSVVWSESSSATAEGSILYTVERKLTSAPDDTYAEVATVTDATSYFDEQCQPGTSYSYRVRARNYAGISAYSSPFTATVPLRVTDEVIPTSDLRLWLKADAGLGLDGLNNWPDQSSTGNHARQVNRANLPVILADAANGRPAVRFDGQASELNLQDHLSGLAAGELFIVHRSRAAQGTANGWHDFSPNFYHDFNYYPYSDGRIYDGFGSDARKDAVEMPPGRLREFHLYNVRTSANEWKSAINGLAQYTTRSNTVGFPASPKVGANGFANLHFKGDIVEIMIFDRLLRPTERQWVSDYLGAKYFLADLDLDSDGLTNAQELALGTDPFNPDTNGDGISDSVSLQLGLDPLAVGSFDFHTPPAAPGSVHNPMPTIDPNDLSAPVITLTAPVNAVPLP